MSSVMEMKTGEKNIRNPQKSMFDQFISHPLISIHRKSLDFLEQDLRKFMFAVDHHNHWDDEAISNRCKETWSLLEDKYSWNVSVCFMEEFVNKCEQHVPFETIVVMSRLFPMLVLNPKSVCYVRNCPCRNDSFDTPSMPILVATDFDGTYNKKTNPAPPARPRLVISGRTFEEYDSGNLKKVAGEMPVYIRGSGIVGDGIDAGEFKAEMINRLGVTHFLEDDPTQIEIIKRLCPHVVVCEVV